MGVSRNCPNFLSTPPLSQERVKLRTSTLARDQSEQKPFKNFGEKGAWAYPRASQIFRVLPIISGARNATNFKFGSYVQRVHPNNNH